MIPNEVALIPYEVEALRALATSFGTKGLNAREHYKITIVVLRT